MVPIPGGSFLRHRDTKVGPMVWQIYQFRRWICWKIALAVPVPINNFIKLDIVSVNGPRETFFVYVLHTNHCDKNIVNYISSTKAEVLPKGRSSTANSETKVAVLLGMKRYGSFLLLFAPHSLFSIWTDLNIWKDPRGTSKEVRRVDLANWALWTSPKFITGVKYQLHQGFWPYQRSGNPTQSLPPYVITMLIIWLETKNWQPHYWTT